MAFWSLTPGFAKVSPASHLVLSPEFAAERFAILSNPEHPETLPFNALYGEIYRQKVCSWFAKVAGGAEVS